MPETCPGYTLIVCTSRRLYSLFSFPPKSQVQHFSLGEGMLGCHVENNIPNSVLFISFKGQVSVFYRSLFIWEWNMKSKALSNMLGLRVPYHALTSTAAFLPWLEGCVIRKEDKRQRGRLPHHVGSPFLDLTPKRTGKNLFWN